ncbi:hypothetical protein [Actinoallomurus sp. CA-150999]|uniref:hypothetical protein n=1 Tax=Actinoallomurus sp. CA-150999 TaxID=3239887 RepID=UPI003D91071F
MSDPKTTEMQRRQRAGLVAAFSRRAWQPGERQSVVPRILAGAAALIVVSGVVVAVGALASHSHKNRTTAAANTMRPSDRPQHAPSPSLSTSPTPLATVSPSKGRKLSAMAPPARSASSAPSAPRRDQVGIQSESNQRPSAGGPPWTTRVLHAPYVLRSGRSVRTNRIVLTMQTDGNLVLSDKNGKPMWATNTFRPGAHAMLQTDGNLVVLSSGNRPIWGAGCQGHDHATMVLQSDANLVIKDRNGSPTWASDTWR